VRTLTELHGGTVSATSTVGRGTLFTVMFPARTELSDPADASAAMDFTQVLSGLRVLLVEDDRDSREILSTVLRQYGVEVIEASSTVDGIAALDACVAAGRLPDTIISDIGLPGEDGYRLLEILGGRPASLGGAIPVVAVTAYGRPQDKRRALAAGFRVHLTKPVDPVVIATALANLNGDSAK